jgi:hypothetical protein
MYTGFLHLHNILRWLLLISLVITLIKYLWGWFGKHEFRKTDNLLGLIFTSLMDLQLLTGLLLYFFLSPLNKIALSDFRAAMKNQALRFYAVEHLLMMLIAVILVHLGRFRSKRATTHLAKFRIASVYYMIALVIMVAAIPWERM